MVSTDVDRSSLLSLATMSAPDVTAMHGCLSDTGCPSRPTPLPPCPTGLGPLKSEEIAANAAALLGREVAAKGAFGWTPWVATSSGCSTCCNTATYPLHVGALSIDAMCLSDDSAHVCCAIETPPEVVAVGLLVANQNVAGTFMLQGTSLCDPAKTALAPPTPAANDGTVFAELGCYVSGRAVPPYATFASGDRRCGCFDGKVDCTAPSKRCFDRGKWYEHGQKVTALRPRDVECRCEQGDWSCDSRGRVPRALIGFGDDGMDAASKQELAKYSPKEQRLAYEFELSGPPQRVVLVRDTLVAAGMTKRQLRIVPLSPPPRTPPPGMVALDVTRVPR
jgi:hypothetical protein